ncbi:hypothetical protein CYMTET_5430 [Cymbomonas tetramitiformis]|uniref:NADP-dependent oxidoreductase domain-containing protein n=1 Tax=Cymbomonas tetramitiformis TaxID=36881 RepID=A0AAE0LJ31_9CHLO|nr:hypothetical protein CYMTET_5430 [Cymbomonas tetramitiformis]
MLIHVKTDFDKVIPLEGHVGRALHTSGLPRKELWLTNKIDGLPSGDYSSVRARVEAMLAEVQVDHFDLLLINYPLPAGTALDGNPEALARSENWAHFERHLLEAWTNMSRLRQDGLAIHVGVSNFYTQHLEALQDVIIRSNKINKCKRNSTPAHTSDPEPHGNDLAPIYAAENFIDLAHPEYELVEYCFRHSIRCLAYRSVYFIGVYEIIGLLEPLEGVVSAVGVANVHQLVLAWLLSRGVSPITSSSNKDHLRSNYEALSASRQLRTCNIDSSASEILGEALNTLALAFRGMGDLHGIPVCFGIS